ncbi:hypothetical protein HMPREF0518_0701 [Lactobacillus helveticus DSM 20075 = CGMCC 1.1877]|nr:hypothetical protein HMPREF0518_0701 [Lactobacillus helveticus DSM 20075 = CGMCC 1.1877]
MKNHRANLAIKELHKIAQDKPVLCQLYAALTMALNHLIHVVVHDLAYF